MRSLASGASPSSRLATTRPGETLETRDGIGPFLRHLGKGEQAAARILAALGVVRGGGDHGVRPVARPRREVVVERLDAKAEMAGIAADLVERQQRHEAVEQGVLEALGHDRAGELLEAAAEAAQEVRVGAGPARRRRGGRRR